MYHSGPSHAQLSTKWNEKANQRITSNGWKGFPIYLHKDTRKNSIARSCIHNKMMQLLMAINEFTYTYMHTAHEHLQMIHVQQTQYAVYNLYWPIWLRGLKFIHVHGKWLRLRWRRCMHISFVQSVELKNTERFSGEFNEKKEEKKPTFVAKHFLTFEREDVRHRLVINKWHASCEPYSVKACVSIDQWNKKNIALLFRRT